MANKKQINYKAIAVMISVLGIIAGVSGKLVAVNKDIERQQIDLMVLKSEGCKKSQSNELKLEKMDSLFTEKFSSLESNLERSTDSILQAIQGRGD